MNKLFAQFVLFLSTLCFGNAFAEQVNYSVKNGFGQPVGQMVVNYNQNGYEAAMNGQKISVAVTHGTAVITMGKLIMTMHVGENYYHNQVGIWRTTPVTTSFGDKGYARMLYSGLRAGGRLYHEELWLNGQFFSHTVTTIDHNDQIVWSMVTDREGKLSIERM